MKEPTETQEGSHSLRSANLHFVLAWMLVNIASTASAAPPSIDYPPRSQTVIFYQQAAFGVIARGSTPLSYQWRKDGVPIAGVTNDQVVLAQAQFSDSGLYSVVVSNAEGSVTSAEAGLTVNPPKAGDVDFSFVWGGSINGTVESFAVQPDGKILIGGGFTTVHDAVRGGIARLNADGSTDYTFMQGLSGVEGSVHAIGVQSDGKVLIGGYFNMVNGVNRKSIARLNADGSLDTSFQTEISGAGFLVVSSIAVQSDGKVLILGDFTAVNGVSRTNIARLHADGTLDSGFEVELAANEGPNVFSVAVQTDDKVLIGGRFTSVNGVSRHSIARLNADGSLDSTFQVELKARWVDSPSVFSVAVQTDGKVLIGGDFNIVNGVGRNAIARLNADGTLDRGFQNVPFGFDGSVSSVVAQGDGKVLVGGSFTLDLWVTRDAIARLNADGSLDTGFQSSVSRAGGGLDSLSVSSAIAVQSDGKVLIKDVTFGAIGGFCCISRALFGRLNSDGTLDSSFQSALTGANSSNSSVLHAKFSSCIEDDLLVPCSRHQIYSVAVLSDGKVLIGGYFDKVNGLIRNGIARLNADGSLDSTFQVGLANEGGASPSVSWVSVQTDGKVLIGGSFTSINGVSRQFIARLNADGTLDRSFQSGLSGVVEGVSSFAVQSDGKVLIGGYFNTVNAEVRIIFARLNPNGSLDSGFKTEISSDLPSVGSIAVQSDGKVLIGGHFTTVNGESRINIARLNADGALDSGFQNGLAGIAGTPYPQVSSIAVQSDGKVLIAGGFTAVNGVDRTNIARLNADGTLDSAFQAPANSYVSSVVVPSDGKVFIAGGFTIENGFSRDGIARLNADGTLDRGFPIIMVNPPSGACCYGYAIAVQSDGKVLIGGVFTIVNGAPAPGIARLWASADVPPRIQSVHRSGADVNLTWDAIPNRTYHVQYKENLSANNWTDLAGDISTSTGTASKTDSTLGNTTQRFYRVLLLP